MRGQGKVEWTALRQRVLGYWGGCVECIRVSGLSECLESEQDWGRNFRALCVWVARRRGLYGEG